MIPQSDPNRRTLELYTASEWSEDLWTKIRPVYEASFPEHIRKPERIVRNMMAKMDVFLHEGTVDGATCSMALTGLSADSRLLIIDYLAVSPPFRSRGAGRQTVRAIAEWAANTYGVQGLLIEAEADDSEIGRSRTRFWQSCGFEITDYVHSYIWVPEKYRAMLLDLQPESAPDDQKLPRDGRRLFDAIEAFHRASFAR